MAKYSEELLSTIVHKIELTNKEFKELMNGYSVWVTINDKNYRITNKVQD